jgi:O-antigen/teichoic acid export membrane protein
VAMFVAADANLTTVSFLYLAGYSGSGAMTLYVALGGVPAATPDDLDAPSLRAMISFGLRGLLGTVVPLEGFRLDQLLVAVFLTPAALGLYVVATAFTNLPRFVATSIGMVAYPHIAETRDFARAKRQIWRFFGLTVVVCSVVVGVLMVTVAWLLPFFFGEEFEEAVSVAQILLVATLFLSVRRTLSDAVRGAGFPGLGSISETISWVPLVPACALLAPAMGVDGVALGLTGSALPALVYLLIATARLRPPVSPIAPAEGKPLAGPEPDTATVPTALRT